MDQPTTATAPTNDEDGLDQETAKARHKAMLEPIYRFTVTWSAPNGSMFHGEFAHQVPTVAEQLRIEQKVGTSRAASLGDLSVTAERMAGFIAHLDATLIERPSWAKDLGALHYVDLVLSLAKEAMAHCATFCVHPGGQGDGGDLAEGRRDPNAPMVRPAL